MLKPGLEQVRRAEAQVSTRKKPHRPERARPLALASLPAPREIAGHLQSRTNASSLSEVIRRALALYDLLVEHYEEKGEVVLKHHDGTTEKLRLL